LPKSRRAARRASSLGQTVRLALGGFLFQMELELLLKLGVLVGAPDQPP
jgi:hypothetical protein